MWTWAGLWAVGDEQPVKTAQGVAKAGREACTIFVN